MSDKTVSMACLEHHNEGMALQRPLRALVLNDILRIRFNRKHSSSGHLCYCGDVVDKYASRKSKRNFIILFAAYVRFADKHMYRSGAHRHIKQPNGCIYIKINRGRECTLQPTPDTR